MFFLLRVDDDDEYEDGDVNPLGDKAVSIYILIFQTVTYVTEKTNKESYDKQFQ